MYPSKLDTFKLAPLLIFSIFCVPLIIPSVDCKFPNTGIFCVCRQRCLRLHQLVYDLTVFPIEVNFPSEVFVLIQARSSSKHVTLYCSPFIAKFSSSILDFRSDNLDTLRSRSSMAICQWLDVLEEEHDSLIYFPLEKTPVNCSKNGISRSFLFGVKNDQG